MTLRNPFKKKPEKKPTAPVQTQPPSGTTASYGPVSDPTPYVYSPPPVRSDDCATGSSGSHHSGSASHSYDGGGHSHSYSHDSGSHSSYDGGGSSYDSGSSGCDSGGGF